MIDYLELGIRSKLLKGNLPLAILLMLSWEPMNSWELLQEIRSKLHLIPDENQFTTDLQLLIDDGFLKLQSTEPAPRMFTSASGLDLLDRLEVVQGSLESMLKKIDGRKAALRRSVGAG